MINGILLVAAVTIATWVLLSNLERAKLDAFLEVEASNARDLISHDLGARLDAINRLGQRLGRLPDITEGEFRHEARSYLRDMPGFHIISWVDADDRLSVIEPSNRSNLVGMSLSDLGAGRLEFSQRARGAQAPIISDPITLYSSGEQGFLIAKAVRREGVHLGTIWVVMRVPSWIDALYMAASGNLFEKVNLQVELGDKRVYETVPDQPPKSAKRAEPLRIAGATVGLTASPKPAFVEIHGSNTSVVIGVLICVLSAALVFTAHVVQSLRTQERLTRTANEDLRAANMRMQREVDQRRNAEAAAKRSSAAKSQFLSVMSHEMRTPMNAILGMVELLLHSNPTTAQKEHLVDLRGAARALLQNVKDVLDFAKLETGNIVLENSACDPGKLVAEATNLLRHLAEKKGLALTCTIDPSVSEPGLFDRARLRQIVLNLLRNAVKFTEQGEICVDLRLVEEGEVGAALLLQVRDTGCGIPQEKIESIFLAFQQVNGQLDRKYEGTGLGLSIVERIVSAMGGTISVTTEMGRGSEFTVTLPFVPASADTSTKVTEFPKPAHDILKGATVLLAEDNLTNQKIVKGFLKGSGIQIDIAADGDEAVNLFERADYDLVLMDVSMPNRNGFDATREIRTLEQRRQSAPCPIIAYTANYDEEDQQKCFAAGMNDILAKPASRRELADRLAHWLSRAKYSNAQGGLAAS